MADEIKPDDAAVVVEAVTPVEVAAPKKRGPRAKKATADATTAEASVASPARRGRRRKDASADVNAVQTKTGRKPRVKGAAKAAAKSVLPKSSEVAPVSVLDEITDLLQLEEENARLRKALAEKLRAENADLRKRLGRN